MISPIDFLPELFLGSLGYMDDFVVFLMLVAFFVVNNTIKEIQLLDKTPDKNQKKVDFEYEDAEFEEIKE